MFDVFVFMDIEMLFTGREKAFCVLEYAQSQLNKTVQHACDRVLKAVANSNADLDMAQKIQRGRIFVLEKSILTTKNIRRDGRVCS